MTDWEKRTRVLYYGESRLCNYWVRYWEHFEGAHLEFTRIGSEEMQQSRTVESSIQVLRPDSRALRGVDGVFAIVEQISPHAFWLVLYRRLPLFAALCRIGFEWLMQHSNAAYRWAVLFWGEHPLPSRYAAISWIFLRLLALVYIAAFASMGLQIQALVGLDGILPIAYKLNYLREVMGWAVYWNYPTLFWIDASDQCLVGVCVAGILSALAALFNRFTPLALLICYVLYLSIVYAGQDFTSFQWDLLLLEAGFLGVFLCGGSFVIVFLYRWLLFRFMLLGGLVKLASGDPTWRNLTALAYHYETQPLPSPLAWYAHQLPIGFHQLAVAGVLFIELVLPFFIFLPRRPRVFAAWGFILLQCSIILTGNYNFFNLLTITLCLFLFEDSDLARFFGTERIENLRRSAPKPGSMATRSALALACIVLISNATLAWSSNQPNLPPQPFYGLMEMTLILAIANTYGPFAVMTTRRGEIEIEASMNGRDWESYEFRYKPSRLDKDLIWLIPHQPRLDWQMWFAALRPGSPPFWLGQLMERLKQASPAVTSLFEKVPFPGRKPRYLRARFYRYRYTNWLERKADGAIWKRNDLGLYWPT